MNLTLLFAIEIILFNASIIFLYQPDFIFILNNNNKNNKTARIFFNIGILCLLLLFICSFLIGANFILYRKIMLIH